MIENPTREQLRKLTGIIYLFTNKVNGKNYVGQTILTFYDRYCRLEVPDHDCCKLTSKYLSRAIKKYGEKSFFITILENNKTPKELDYFEDFYAIKYNCYAPNGYNLDKCGIKAGNKRHELTILKYRKKWILYSPTGIQHNIDNLPKFCEEHNLSATHMRQVFNGKRGHHNGWTKDEKKSNYFVFVSPEFHEIKIKICYKSIYLKEFCQKHNLSYGCILHLIKGRILSHRGWTFKLDKKN